MLLITLTASLIRSGAGCSMNFDDKENIAKKHNTMGYKNSKRKHTKNKHSHKSNSDEETKEEHAAPQKHIFEDDGRTFVKTSAGADNSDDENDDSPSKKSCTRSALRLLREKYYVGYEIYKLMTKKEIFNFFLDCSKPDYDVESAVHESLHSIDLIPWANSFKYYQPDGTTLCMPQKNLFYRREIANYLNAEDLNNFAATYLSGKSWNQDIGTLLDELSAYTYSLEMQKILYNPNTENHVHQSSDRDWLATFMQYTELYLKCARLKHPDDWEKIYSDENYLHVIQTLRSRAEKVMASSLWIKEIGINDGPILKKVYNNSNINELITTFKKGNKEFVYKKPPLESL